MPYARVIRPRQNRLFRSFGPRNTPGRTPVVRRGGRYYVSGAMSFPVRGRPGTSRFDRSFYVRRGR